ncbi:hypothetical protein V9T40_010543 [Parthenolecanium corni]|uniref:Uncharacterized protein n=1 Tax=Parthenolecanium corni TaxID=536013 RepID=A0AAN9TGX3_9HEMI
MTPPGPRSNRVKRGFSSVNRGKEIRVYPRLGVAKYLRQPIRARRFGNLEFTFIASLREKLASAAIKEGKLCETMGSLVFGCYSTASSSSPCSAVVWGVKPLTVNCPALPAAISYECAALRCAARSTFVQCISYNATRGDATSFSFIKATIRSYCGLAKRLSTKSILHGRNVLGTTKRGSPRPKAMSSAPHLRVYPSRG